MNDAELRRNSPQFLVGMEDFKKGLKTNPYTVPRWARAWQAGYDYAKERSAANRAA